MPGPRVQRFNLRAFKSPPACFDGLTVVRLSLRPRVLNRDGRCWRHGPKPGLGFRVYGLADAGGMALYQV